MMLSFVDEENSDSYDDNEIDDNKKKRVDILIDTDEDYDQAEEEPFNELGE